ncbi:MAG: tetratricopeptide repeat protein, partial [Bacteroidota bacterium]
MVTLITRTVSAALLALLVAGVSTAQVDQQELGRNWSLFSEYHKNGDFATAAPYGWKVIQIDPTRFKTVYSRLAECYFGFYEKAEPEQRTPFADTMLIIYDLGIKHVPDRAASLWLAKAYALENYFEGRDVKAIEAYEKAIAIDFAGTDFAYIDRLGVLYVKNRDTDPEYRDKAVVLYRRAYETWPDNLTPVQRLKILVSDPAELIELAEKDLESDPDNLEKLWSAAQAYVDGERWQGAEKHLHRLIKLAPTNAAYWNELGKAQQRQGKYRQAIESYESALKLNRALKENFLNISECYRMLKNFPAARQSALRATQADRGWGRPYIFIGEIFKAT